MLLYTIDQGKAAVEINMPMVGNNIVTSDGSNVVIGSVSANGSLELNGIEYGVGIRNNYYEGKSCGWDECVWINGKMLGYCHSLEIEFEAYETKKYGFVLNDTYVGKYMTIYEDGTEEYMYGMALNID